jgi:hypothetical protein
VNASGVLLDGLRRSSPVRIEKKRIARAGCISIGVCERHARYRSTIERATAHRHEALRFNETSGELLVQ